MNFRYILIAVFILLLAAPALAQSKEEQAQKYFEDGAALFFS